MAFILDLFHIRTEYTSLKKRNRINELKEYFEKLIKEGGDENVDIINLDFRKESYRITVSYDVTEALEEIGWKIQDYRPDIITAEYISMTIVKI